MTILQQVSAGILAALAAIIIDVCFSYRLSIGEILIEKAIDNDRRLV